MALLSKSNDVTINIHEICHHSAFRGVLCSTGFYLPIPVSMTEGINIPNKQQNSKSRIILWLGIRVTLYRVWEDPSDHLQHFHFTEKHYIYFTKCLRINWLSMYMSLLTHLTLERKKASLTGGARGVFLPKKSLKKIIMFLEITYSTCRISGKY